MDNLQSQTVGELVRHWRTLRGLSQLDLACEAQVSSRHISFIETGRSKPSREMVLQLASVLDVPLRQRNVFLMAAGFAPLYRTSILDDPQLEYIRRTLNLILDKHEPYAALVMDASWNLIMVNQSAALLREATCLNVEAVLADGPPNLLRLLFHPQGVGHAIANWDEVARATLTRVYRQLQAGSNEELRSILDQVLTYPGVPANFHAPTLCTTLPLMVPVSFRLGDDQLDLFSTVTTLGSALDITLHELHIEAYYPANEHSEGLLKSWVRQHNL